MSASSRPLILVSNDDSIYAPGIRYLVELLRELNAEIVVVAPADPQSGKGHAITIGHPLRLDASDRFGPEVAAYACTGTPADCVKIAKHYVLAGRRPDLVVSGINHGSNSSVNVLYSGTMSAAIEAAIEGLPAVGFSLCDYGEGADFSHVGPWVLQVCRLALGQGLPAYTALNVNIPKKSAAPIQGLRLGRQARAKWDEKFEQRLDPYQRPYYWLLGDFVNHDRGRDTDEAALADNYVSVVPCRFDLTNYEGLTELAQAWQLPLPPATPAAAPPQPVASEDYGPAAEQ
ncbi:MAG: 5'/3'-nucleotidase SurE [Janthinobacterium lividum]